MTPTIIHRRHLTPRTDYIAPGTQKLDIQLTPPDESHVPSEMMDLTIQDQSTTHSYQDARRRGSPHHVKMGNRSSCPRTPLRSAGSSSGLTPTIRRWRQSGTESETSVLSSSIPDHIGTDLSHCSDDFDSILSLSFARSITPEPTGKPGSFSTPSTLSRESCPSEAGSMYSNDSYRVKRITSEVLSPSDTVTLAPSPSFASPFPSNLSISFDDDDSQALPHSRESSVKSTSAFSNNRSRAAAHAITPSLITEPTKTIQARRSFGQLLLFRRPSQVRDGGCMCAQGCKLHQRDEEQEELQTCVDIGTPPGTINYFGDAGGASNSLHSVYNSAENINIRNQSGTTRDSSALPSNEELGTLKAADQLNSQQSRGASSKEAPPENSSTRRRSSTILSRPIGFLKMVKSQSSLRETFFGPKRSQRSQSVQFDHLPSNNPQNLSQSSGSKNQVAPPGDRPMFNDTLRSRSETGRSYFSTFHPGKIGQTTEFPRDSQDITADRHSKRGSVTHSTPLNIFKFWKKKKNEESAKASPTIAQALEKAGKKRDAKKKTGRHFIKIEQISSPILIGSNDPIPSLSLKTRPLMLSPKLRDDEPNLSRRLTSSESQTLSCSPKSQVNSTKVPQSPGSANRFAHEISTLGPYASNQTLTVQLANLDLPKPSRPPRRRPVMMSTL
ncbi:hypothetical protein PSTG_06639 [Puccinia striiformis f. sp. tritici PST-78]|uniref:Uncharacterized protein n=1 Tax=Puccinia striiformis f. sp. tritici PST-78 TaxID=1165861 RepID=A0A0L0VLR9_9BASI|nr:hypothetical protein PSTG_06639 [Puccinia striiformis f. sp. tritici PST-78]